jgi:hypothetical protein
MNKKRLQLVAVTWLIVVTVGSLLTIFVGKDLYTFLFSVIAISLLFAFFWVLEIKENQVDAVYLVPRYKEDLRSLNKLQIVIFADAFSARQFARDFHSLSSRESAASYKTKLFFSYEEFVKEHEEDVKERALDKLSEPEKKVLRKSGF